MEEQEKNGQEDTHFYMYIMKDENGDFDFDSEAEDASHYEIYGDDPETIVDYIKKHGFPEFG